MLLATQHLVVKLQTCAVVLAKAFGKSASIAIVCVPDDEAATRIVRTLRGVNADCVVVVRCRYQANASKLTRSGANRVISEEAEARNAIAKCLEQLER